jgi:hypothetical protein
MPVTAEQVAGYIGLDLTKIEDENALKEAFDGTFVRRDLAADDKDIAGRIFGKTNDILRRKVLKAAKEFELEIDADINPGDGIELLANSLKDRTSKLATELEQARKGAKSTKEVEEMAASLKALQAERDAAFKQAKEFEGKYTELHTSLTHREQQAKVDAAYKEAMAGLEFNPELPRVAVTGFEATFRSTYQPDWTEDGKLRWKDKDGQLVMDPAKAQTYRAGGDLAKAMAEQEKLLGKPAAAPVRKVITTTPAAMGGQASQTPAPAAGRRVRPIAEPRAW